MSEFNSVKVISELESIIKHHNVMKKSYFLTPPSSANNRRRYEEVNSHTYEFNYNNDTIKVSQQVSCSCHNIYYSLHIYKNGVIVDANIKFIKNIINVYLPLNIRVYSSDWKWDYEKEKLRLLKPNATVDCGHQNCLKLVVLNNTTILNPGFDCTIIRKDIKKDSEKLLIAFARHITNDKGIAGYSNENELAARMFDNLL